MSQSPDDPPARASAGRVARALRAIDPFGTPATFRLRVVIVLAAVSLLSAYVAYVAAIRDGHADDLAALASEQAAEEQQVQQYVQAEVAQDERLAVHMDTVRRDFFASNEDASRLIGTDAKLAARYDLKTQGGLTEFYLLWPFLHTAEIEYEADGGVSYDAAAAQTALLSEDERLYRPSSESTRAEANGAAFLGGSTKLIVVVLVIALFLLTLAHVLSGRRGAMLARTGSVIAIVAVVWFAVQDVWAAIPVLIAAMVAVGVVFLARIPRVRSWLQVFDRSNLLAGTAIVPSQPEGMLSSDPSDPPTSRLDRYVVVAIAVATLLGASVGFLQAQASRSSDEQAWLAHDLGVAAIGALRGSEEQLALKVGTYEDAMSSRVEAWNARQAAAYATWAGDAAEAQRQTAEYDRLTTLADRLEERSGLAGDLGDAGSTQADKLVQLRAQVWHDAARIAALQDAAHSATLNWSGRAGSYLTVLAWLAVAAYLLGLSLVFRDRRARIVLTGAGSLLLLAALVQSTVSVSAPLPVSEAVAREAADAYAAGYVALAEGDSMAAQSQFTRAIDARSDFGMAHRDRAAAIMLAGSLDGYGPRAAFTETTVNRAIEDLEVAQANRADTAAVRLNLGALLFHRAIDTQSSDDLGRSVDASRRALELGENSAVGGDTEHKNQLVVRMNLALGALGLGDLAGAITLYREIGDEVAELPPYQRPYFVGGALAPLDRLADAARPVEPLNIQAAKEALLAHAYATGDSPAPAVTNMRVELFPTILQWRATIADLDDADQVAVQWYELDPELDRWSAVPVVSGPLTFGAFDVGGQFNDSENDEYWGNSQGLIYNLRPTCVQPGHYRAELYINGHLQATAETETPSDYPDYSALKSPDVGAALCHETDWSTTGVAGQWSAATSPDGSRGIAILRVQHPLALSWDQRAVVIGRAVTELSSALPAGLTGGHDLAGSVPTVFNGRSAVWREYGYPGGTARFAATTLSSGTTLVVAVYGPADWVTSAEAEGLLLSTAPINQ